MDAERRDEPFPEATSRRPWRLAGWVVVLGLFALVVRALLPQTLGEQARRRLEAKLAAHYGAMEVSIGSGRYEPDVGMIFERLELKPRGLPAAARPLVTIRRVIAEADFDWQRIQAGEFPLTPRRMRIDGLELTAWIDAQGNWSVAGLMPLPELGPGCPLIVIRDARLRLLRDPRNPSHALVLRDLDLRITKGGEGGEGDLEIVAVGAGESVRRLEVAVQGRKHRQQWSARVSQFHFAENLFDRLPAAWADKLQPLRGLEAVADVELHGELRGPQLLDWDAKLTLHEGRFQHPRVPTPIEELRGVIHLGPGGLTVEAAQGTIEEAICRVTGKASALAWPCQLDIHLWADSLQLNERLAAALPADLRDQWDRFAPQGHVDLDARLQYRDAGWQTEAVVQCKGVDVRYHKFPYPVQQLTGTLRCVDHEVWSEQLRGTIDGQPMECAFRATPAETGGPWWFEVTSDGPVALDETLLQALTPQEESPSGLETFVRSLAPEGSLHLAHARLAREPSGRVRRSLQLAIQDGRIRYEHFPYPLHQLQGEIRIEGERVQIVDFRGRNGAEAVIRCSGQWEAGPQGGALDLGFQGTRLPLDQTLRSALSPAAQQTWDALAPSGVLQEIAVEVESVAGRPHPQLTIVAQQGGAAAEGTTIASLRPTALPYRLDIVDGRVSFDGERLLVDRLDGRHEGSRLIATGSCAPDRDGRWLLDLDVLSGSRLRPDADLFAALPVDVRGVFQRLQLRGPVNIRGQTKLRLPNQTETVPETEWDLLLQLEGNRIGDVGPVHDIRGELSVRGRQDATGVRADGVVQIDSMHYYDLQLTSVSGPFSIRGDTLELGTLQPGLGGKPQIQPIRGKAFAGEVQLAGEVSLSSGAFSVHARVDELRVPRLLVDMRQPQSNMTGQIDGQVELEGTVGAAHLLKGVGSAVLTGANLYQIPQIVQLLTQLRIQPDEEVAFTDGTAEFTISGDQIQFSQLQLWGDLVALHGSGSVSRLRDLDLVFNTRVSPHNTWSRLISPLGNQRYTLWTLSVQGPLDDPTIQRNALDGVSETLERLFPGMGRPAQHSAQQSAQHAAPRFLPGVR